MEGKRVRLFNWLKSWSDGPQRQEPRFEALVGDSGNADWKIEKAIDLLGLLRRSREIWSLGISSGITCDWENSHDPLARVPYRPRGFGFTLWPGPLYSRAELEGPERSDEC